jgi:formate dehydrogenase subunit gamma
MADHAKPRMLPRYRTSERMNHWMIALTFILAALSGLALFHPSMFFFVNFFGGGAWTRILHPFIGILMFAGFLVLFLRLAKDNILNREDREWLAHSTDLLAGRKDRLPPAGKYNGAQKVVFWLMALSLLVLIVTGVMFWRPYFEHAFSIPLQRAAVLAHSIAAFVLILTTIVHIYAAIWVKGTIRAMTRGTVTEGWAKANHPLWYRRMVGQRESTAKR